jgi:cobalt-zinc-cadmium efflux system protein
VSRRSRSRASRGSGTAPAREHGHGPQAHDRHTRAHDQHAHLGHQHGLLHALHGTAQERAAGRRREEWRPLLLAFVITSLILVAEAVGGVLTGSLALLTDAGHMLTDAASLGLALIALRVSGLPPTLRRTFGWQRFEILAALLNGLTLWAIVVLLAWEAIQRLQQPRPIAVVGMIAVASIGLLANVVSALILGRVSGGGMNLRAALLHVRADLLGSVGTIAAGAAIWATGWLAADPLASLLICALILYSSWNLVRDAVNVLMEATPPGLDLELIQAALMGETGVRAVHDLHVWTVTSGFHALSAHVEADPALDREQLLRRLNFLLRERFALTHTTLQIEEPRPAAGALQIERRPRSGRNG